MMKARKCKIVVLFTLNDMHSFVFNIIGNMPHFINNLC